MKRMEWQWLEFLTGLFIGAFFALFVASQGMDPDLQKIQRQRNAMRLYEEASK